MQCNDGLVTFDSNDFHDPFFPNANSWAYSLPQGNTSSTNNVAIANVTPVNDRNGNPPSYAGYGIEFWGGLTSSNNLIQGLFGGGISWGFCSSCSPWTINNNIIQLSTTSNFIACCDQGASNPPTQSGNSTSTTVSTRASVAPNISPAAGAVTFPLTVTLTDAGYTGGVGPLGNTGIWYTTDGSTPVPGSNGKYLASGGTFSLASAATVKAVGMWGALNQPTSYASGFGFTPSSTVSSAFTGGGGPTLTGGFLSTTPINGVNTMTVGGATVQMAATGNYSDGSTGAFPSPVWASNATGVCTINSSTGLVTAVAGGFCQVQAHNGSVFTSPWGITVGTVTMTSGMLCKTGSASGGLPGPGGTNPTQGIACHP